MVKPEAAISNAEPTKGGGTAPSPASTSETAGPATAVAAATTTANKTDVAAVSTNKDAVADVVVSQDKDMPPPPPATTTDSTSKAVALAGAAANTATNTAAAASDTGTKATDVANVVVPSRVAATYAAIAAHAAAAAHADAISKAKAHAAAVSKKPRPPPVSSKKPKAAAIKKKKTDAEPPEEEETEEKKIMRSLKRGMKPLPEDFVPGEHSVLCGRGKGCYNSRGSQHLRELVTQLLPDFMSSDNTPHERINVVKKAIRHVMKRCPEGGAFVMSKGGRYYELSDKAARDKVGALFRDSVVAHEKKIQANKEKQEKAGAALLELQQQPMQIEPPALTLARALEDGSPHGAVKQHAMAAIHAAADSVTRGSVSKRSENAAPKRPSVSATQTARTVYMNAQVSAAAAAAAAARGPPNQVFWTQPSALPPRVAVATPPGAPFRPPIVQGGLPPGAPFRPVVQGAPPHRVPIAAAHPISSPIQSVVKVALPPGARPPPPPPPVPVTTPGFKTAPPPPRPAMPAKQRPTDATAVTKRKKVHVPAPAALKTAPSPPRSALPAKRIPTDAAVATTKVTKVAIPPSIPGNKMPIAAKQEQEEESDNMKPATGTAVPRKKLRCLSKDAIPITLDNKLNQYAVLCGRGKGFYNASGNRKLRRLIDNLMPEYSACEMSVEKSNIILEVVETIKAAGGIFLMAEKGQYFQLSDKAAHTKVGAMFRDYMNKTFLPQQAAMEREEKSEFTGHHGKDIKEPHDHDVLCGRGAGIDGHPGNEHWRHLIQINRTTYLSLPKSQRPTIAGAIVREIRARNPGGRFLSKDPMTRLWFDIGDDRATAKTGQAMLDKSPPEKQPVSKNAKKKTTLTSAIVMSAEDARQRLAALKRKRGINDDINQQDSDDDDEDDWDVVARSERANAQRRGSDGTLSNASAGRRSSRASLPSRDYIMQQQRLGYQQQPQQRRLLYPAAAEQHTAISSSEAEEDEDDNMTPPRRRRRTSVDPPQHMAAAVAVSATTAAPPEEEDNSLIASIRQWASRRKRQAAADGPLPNEASSSPGGRKRRKRSDPPGNVINDPHYNSEDMERRVASSDEEDSEEDDDGVGEYQNESESEEEATEEESSPTVVTSRDAREDYGERPEAEEDQPGVDDNEPPVEGENGDPDDDEEEYETI